MSEARAATAKVEERDCNSEATKLKSAFVGYSKNPGIETPNRWRLLQPSHRRGNRATVTLAASPEKRRLQTTAASRGPS